MKTNTTKIIKFIENEDNRFSFFQKLRRRRSFSKFDYSKILFDDLMYSGSYKKDVPINILERLMYLPFKNIKFFLDSISKELLYSMLSNHSASRNYSYIRLIGAAVHAKNKEAISYFNSITKIPSSMFLFEDYLPYEKIDIHTRENFNRLSPAIVAVQNRDIDMLDFLQSFESSGWAGTLTNRFNQPSFIFLHTAIKECDFETVRFIMYNGIQSLTHFDSDGNTPLDYLSMISEEHYLSHKEQYDEMLYYALDKHFNTQSYRKKEMGIKLSSNISDTIMSSLYDIAENLGLPCYIFKNDVLKPLTYRVEYNDFIIRERNLTAIGELFKHKNKEWMIYSKNVRFFKKTVKNIYSNNHKWLDFIDSQSSHLSKAKDNKFDFYEYKKEISQFYTNYPLLDVSLDDIYKNENLHLNSEIDINYWDISNASIKNSKSSSNSPLVDKTELMKVSLTHLNIALMFSDADYLKRCFFSLDIEKNENVYWDLFISSNIIAISHLQEYMANLLLSDDIISKDAKYKCFIFDKDNPQQGIAPLIYYASNKELLTNIDHKKVYENYILFIKSYLRSPLFKNNEKFCHDISIFNQFNVDAEYMHEIIKKHIEPDYSRIVYEPIFKDNLPKLLNNILLNKMTNKTNKIISDDISITTNRKRI